MDIYIVIQEGVYRHDVFLTTAEEKKAINYADNLAETDGDDHHSYIVIKTELNIALNKSKMGTFPYWESEETIVHRSNKN